MIKGQNIIDQVIHCHVHFSSLFSKFARYIRYFTYNQVDCQGNFLTSTHKWDSGALPLTGFRTAHLEDAIAFAPDFFPIGIMFGLVAGFFEKIGWTGLCFPEDASKAERALRESPAWGALGTV